MPKWTVPDDAKLRAAVQACGQDFKRIAHEHFQGQRQDSECMNRWTKVLSPDLIKGPWQREEDDIIIKCKAEGMKKWSEIAKCIPGRVGKQCRERWLNHLDPTLNHGPWTPEEDAILVQKQAELGNKWSKIASFIPGRPENAVKNRWNSFEHRKMMKMLQTSGKVEGGSAAMRARAAASVARANARTTGKGRRDENSVFMAAAAAAVAHASRGEVNTAPLDGQNRTRLDLTVETGTISIGSCSFPATVPSKQEYCAARTNTAPAVDMSLDALAELTPPTPLTNILQADGTCNTATAAATAAKALLDNDAKGAAAAEGKRAFQRALHSSVSDSSADNDLASPAKKQRTPRGFTPRGITPSASQAQQMDAPSDVHFTLDEDLSIFSPRLFAEQFGRRRSPRLAQHTVNTNHPSQQGQGRRRQSRAGSSDSRCDAPMHNPKRAAAKQRIQDLKAAATKKKSPRKRFRSQESEIVAAMTPMTIESPQKLLKEQVKNSTSGAPKREPRRSRKK